VIEERLVSEDRSMDEEINAWARAQAIEQTKGYVYCDLMLRPEEAVALEQLVIELRDGGQHQELQAVFKAIMEEIETARENEAKGNPWPFS
jgi:hypothetical protein